MELVYYFQNIDSLTLESTNFSLNDDEFKKIKEISKNIDNEVLLLFWQFTIKVLEELDIVSNQNISIEMFLIRLIYLSSFKPKEGSIKKEDASKYLKKADERNIISNFKTGTINQIKNVVQEEKDKSKIQLEVKDENFFLINSFDDLLKVCNEKKEMKLKYELEKNVSLVSFDNRRLEISFNDNLDKNFVKDLSSKLFNWTGERWIITFSKMKGNQTIKEKQENAMKEFLKIAKSTDLYKQVIEKFPDANLIDVKPKNNIEE